jgi:signal transduction histidine kinase
VLFLLAAALALLAIAGDPGAYRKLLLVAACDVAVALGALLIPWPPERPNTAALVGVPGFAVLGLSTWTFGGVATGTGPFLVLMYAWAGLHFTRRILLAYTVPASLAYVVPLILTDQPPQILSSAFILLPIALAVAMLIEAQARHLRDDRERLTRIERWRSAMVSTLAHDVRSPLSTVRFALEELQDQVTGDAAPMVDAALRQAARIARLADGLLDLDRIDSAGQLKLDRRVYPARELVQEILADVRSTGVTVEIDGQATLYVDKQRFEQILINLLGNAMRYGRPPIVIRLAGDDAVDRLEVRDHGPGIPETLRSNLFSQFAVGGPEGVGLGLWIVRKLAEVHGGRADAEARDPGVAMVISLPTATAE